MEQQAVRRSRPPSAAASVQRERRRRRQAEQRRRQSRRKSFFLMVVGLFAVVYLCGGNASGDNGTAELPTETVREQPTIPETESRPPETTAPVETTMPRPQIDFDYSKPVPKSEAVGTDYFDDAVFIGDSRTEGLILYTGLTNTTAYVHKGLMVNTIFYSPVINKDGTMVSVMDALQAAHFNKVYISLGINETGWHSGEAFVEQYGEVIEAIREINPSALIYVQEILPVSRKVSSTHAYIRNKKIREYNKLLWEMAQEKEVFFLKTASAVADSEGVLPDEAATDGIHLKVKYCKKWLDYLLTHTVS